MEVNKAKSILLGIFWGVAAVAVCALLWFGYWALRESSVNRNAEIDRNSFERQTTLRSEIVDQYDDIAGVDVQIVQAGDDQELVAVLRAQRVALVDQLCGLSAQLVDAQSVEPTVARIINTECNNR